MSSSGLAEANSTVEVFNDGISLGVVSADAVGNWSMTIALTDSVPYSLTAKATDAAGNTSPNSNALAFYSDQMAPGAPVITGFADNSGSGTDTLTNDTTPTLTITAEAGSTVKVYRDDAYVGDGDAHRYQQPGPTPSRLRL